MSFLDYGNSGSVTDFGLNKAEKFNAWAVKVDKGESDAQDSFRIVRDRGVFANQYKADLKNLAQDYIAVMDTDGDGKISYDEFEKYNEKELRDNVPDIPDDQVAQLKQSLKDIYKRLNIDNEEGSKDNLDYREVMNYFYSMDTNNNDGMSADGNVTKQEYIDTGLMLADKGKLGKMYSQYMKYSFDNLFKEYK